VLTLDSRSVEVLILIVSYRQNNTTMKTHYLLLLGLSLLLGTACNRTIALQNAHQLEDRGDNRNNNPTNDVHITTAYIGDAINHITFQIDVDNRSDQSIIVDASDMALLMDVGGDRRRFARPVHKEDLLRSLRNQKDLLETERKNANTQTAVIGGLDVLAGILSGADAVETVAVGGGYATEAVDRSQRYKMAQRSVEEELAYHEEFSLDRVMLEPGTKGTFDIHFEPPLLNVFAEIEIRCADHVYDFPYQLEVVEENRRRRRR